VRVVGCETYRRCESRDIFGETLRQKKLNHHCNLRHWDYQLYTGDCDELSGRKNEQWCNVCFVENASISNYFERVSACLHSESDDKCEMLRSHYLCF